MASESKRPPAEVIQERINRLKERVSGWPEIGEGEGFDAVLGRAKRELAAWRASANPVLPIRPDVQVAADAEDAISKKTKKAAAAFIGKTTFVEEFAWKIAQHDAATWSGQPGVGKVALRELREFVSVYGLKIE